MVGRRSPRSTSDTASRKILTLWSHRRPTAARLANCLCRFSPGRALADATILAFVEDLRAHDPGLSLAVAGSAPALYEEFPLRMLKPVRFADVAATAGYCARVVGEELAKALRGAR